MWITLSELRERLVHAGVHRSLSVDILEYTMTRINKGEYLELRLDGGTSYYRPVSCQMESGTPLDQRARISGLSNRLPILLSERDYFRGDPETDRKLQEINLALIQYSHELKEFKKFQQQEKKEKEAKEKAAKEKEEQERAAKQREADERAAAERETHDSQMPCVADDGATEEVHDTTESATATEFAEIDFGDTPDNEANGIFSLPLLTKFIHKVSCHAAQCGSPAHLETVDKRYGASIIEHWKCPKCTELFELRNCNWVKTDVVEPGRKYSMPQPEINLRIIKGGHPLGINLEKVEKFMMGTLGVKIANYRNQQHLDKKIRQTVDKLFQERKEENQRKHVEMTKALPDFEAVEFEHNGLKSLASPSNVSMDGVGKKRAFNHRITGDESGLVVQSDIAGVPIELEHSMVSHNRLSVFIY